MENKYLPLQGGEVNQLQFMHSLYRVLKDDDSLRDRLDLTHDWWRYRGIIAQLHGVFDRAWHTIDPEKRERINAVWSQQELRVVNAGQAVDPTGDKLFTPKSVIIDMAQELQKEKCSMCLGTNNDKKDCKFRRAMVAMAIPDLRREEKKSGKCMGHIFDWEG